MHILYDYKNIKTIIIITCVSFGVLHSVGDYDCNNAIVCMM